MEGFLTNARGKCLIASIQDIFAGACLRHDDILRVSLGGEIGPASPNARPSDPCFEFSSLDGQTLFNSTEYGIIDEHRQKETLGKKNRTFVLLLFHIYTERLLERERVRKADVQRGIVARSIPEPGKSKGKGH